MMPAGLPSWPIAPVAYGPVVLRQFSDRDVPMAQELATDPYVPLVGSLPANASREQARDWVDRQRGRLAEGYGFSFAIAEADTDLAVGGIGRWLTALAHGPATAGYSVIPSARGRGLASAALIALTSFGWTIPALHRIELYIEPWNAGSVGTAERAGYTLMAEGRSNKAIAERLFVSEYTVQKHVGNIFDTLRLPPSPDDHRRVLAVVAYLNAQ